MKNTIKDIELKKKKLLSILKNKQNIEVLKKWLLTELAYTSNAIEGNTLTRRETAMAIEQDITSSSKPLTDYIEAKNHSDAFNIVWDLSKKKTKITENDILKIHKNILKGIHDTEKGKYRNVRVRISGSSVVLPNPLKVSKLMKEFLGWLNTSKLTIPEKAIEAHLRLVSIHPFIDGNGRVGRLLMNLILLKNNYYPVIIRKRDRKRYIDSIEKAQLTNNKESYESFMMTALNRSLETYIDMLDIKKEDIETKKLLKISEFADAVGVPISTIRYYLRVEKLKPATKDDNDYMLFSKEQVKEFKKISKK